MQSMKQGMRESVKGTEKGGKIERHINKLRKSETEERNNEEREK